MTSNDPSQDASGFGSVPPYSPGPPPPDPLEASPSPYDQQPGEAPAPGPVPGQPAPWAPPGPPPAYGQPPSYDQPPSYGQPPAYGQSSVPGQPPSYGQPPTYGEPSMADQPPVYDQPPTYGEPSAPGQPPSYGQPPAYGQPYGVPPYAAGAPMYAGGQPPRKKSKAPLFIGIGVTAVVIVIVVMVVVLFNMVRTPTLNPGPSPLPDGGNTPAVVAAATPKEAVEGFLNALADGDAETALAYTQEPPRDTTFLTDDVLQAMNKAHPITDINVDMEDAVQSFGYGTATYKLGDQAVTWPVEVQQYHDRWLMQDVTGTADFSVLGENLALQIDGVDVPDPSSVTLFPGQYDVTTANPMLTLGKTPLTVEFPGMPADTYNLKLAISSDGTKKIQAAAEKKLDGCLKQKSLKPKNCGFGVDSPTGKKVRDSSIAWTLEAGGDKISKIKPEIGYGNPTVTRVYVNIPIKFTCTMTTGEHEYGTVYVGTVTADFTDPDKLAISFGE